MSNNTIQNLALEFKEKLGERYGERFAKLILYGSYARGNFHEESDVDFLVVLNDEKVQNGAEIFFTGDLLNTLSLKYDKLISILPISIRRLQEANSLFYRNVRQEGIEI